MLLSGCISPTSIKAGTVFLPLGFQCGNMSFTTQASVYGMTESLKNICRIGHVHLSFAISRGPTCLACLWFQVGECCSKLVHTQISREVWSIVSPVHFQIARRYINMCMLLGIQRGEIVSINIDETKCKRLVILNKDCGSVSHV